MTIHKTAIIDSSAEIDPSVSVGPYTVIGPRVKIGANTQLMAHVCVDKDTEIGESCRIFPFASVGADPQDLKYNGERTKLIIGDNVTIRESTTIHRGTEGGGGLTEIGSGSLIMATVHVAHDCRLGREVILSSYVVLAGHVEIGDGAIIGGLSAIHQFSRVGEYSFLGGASSASKDIPPFMALAGNREMLITGPNIIGLRRRNMPEENIEALLGAYKIICRNHKPLAEVLELAENKYGHFPEVISLIKFYRSSNRAVYR